MLRITIEIIPGGKDYFAKTLDQINVHNTMDAIGHPLVGNYNFTSMIGPLVDGRIEGFNRELGASALAEVVLKTLNTIRGPK